MEITVAFKDELCYKLIKMFTGTCDKKLFVYITFDIAMHHACLFPTSRGFNFER